VAFPRKLLNDGEDIILDLRPHWWFLFKPLAALTAFLVLSVIVQVNTDNDAAIIVTLIPVVIAALWTVVKYAKWRTTNFVVTTDRLIHRSGIIAKQGKEIPLERLNDITFNQSIFERVIGSGDLMIESGGERGQQLFSDIRKPEIVQNEIYRQIELAQARDHDRMAGRRALSLPEQLEKLDDLRQRGIISQAEFDAKKAKLLDQM
jgi:uncharacterized membrane protein YdbT with pleckstrin-like domain